MERVRPLEQLNTDDLDDLEYLGFYGVGGYMVVHLGGCVGQYKVIHKLGYSVYATVWACRSLDCSRPRYCAVKVFLAGDVNTSAEPWIREYLETDGKLPNSNILLPQSKFRVESPYGSHLAVVYPVFGPPVSTLTTLRSSMEGVKSLRSMAYQITQALSDLHETGICHGNLRPKNVIAELQGLDGSSEADVLSKLGEPVKQHTGVFTYYGVIQTDMPDYRVFALDWTKVKNDLMSLTGKAFLAGLSHAFRISEKPDNLSSTSVYCSPERLLDNRIDFNDDAWALGCVLFELRTGEQIFECGLTDESEFLAAMCMILGKMPEPWWSKTWTERADIFEDDIDEQGRVIERNAGPGDADGEPRSIRLAIEQCYDTSDISKQEPKPLPLEKNEIDLFADLLGKVLKWNPEERASVGEILDHPWFKL